MAIVLQNQDPAPFQSDVDASANINFEVVDLSFGMNPLSVEIRINGDLVWQSRAPLGGYNIIESEVAGGYNYLIDPPQPLPPISIIVGVIAENQNEPPDVLDTSYEFTVFEDLIPPKIVNMSPAANSGGVKQSKEVTFSITDNKNVLLGATQIWVNDVLVFGGSDFILGWAELSFVQLNSGNGYDFVLVKDGPGKWDELEVVTIRVQAEDTSGLPASAAWSFTVEGVEFPFSLLGMVLKSVREMDKQSPGLIEKIITLPGGLNDIWKARVHDRVDLLAELQDIDLIDDMWLPWLKSLLGFTRDIAFQVTEDELRGILRSAMAFWNSKPAELSIDNAIRMITGNRFRVHNWFDLRFQSDHTFVTELLEDFDPYLLDFPSDNPTGQQFRFLGGAIDPYPDSHKFDILDLTPPQFPLSRFLSRHQYLYLQITSYPTNPDREGFYRINNLDFNANTGFFDVNEAVDIFSGFEAEWMLWVANSEYVTEVRLVNNVNRTLLLFLLNLIRPMSERIDVVYIDFLDEFNEPGDLIQWLISGATDPTVPEPGGRVVIPAGSNIEIADANTYVWPLDRTVAFKIAAKSSTTLLDLLPVYVDALNYYDIEIYYDTQTLKVFRRVTGAFTQIGATVSLPTLLPIDTAQPDFDFRDVVRVDVLRAIGADNLIRVYFNGDLVFEEIDNSGVFTQGSAAVFDIIDDGYLYLIEVMLIPAQQDRAGPNP